MKQGVIGDKKMSLMPKWVDHILNILFVPIAMSFVKKQIRIHHTRQLAVGFI